MDQPETVTAVAIPPARRVVCAGKYNLYDLFRLYEVGLRSLGSEDFERWRVTFAMAASAGGVWAVLGERDIHALAVFWRTKNPNVALTRDFPRPDPSGTFLYVGWCWAQDWLVREFKRFVVATQKEVSFVAWHDQRRKRKKRRGRLYTWEMPEAPIGLMDVLGKRNGHPVAVVR
jgi:hypothetical protein